MVDKRSEFIESFLKLKVRAHEGKKILKAQKAQSKFKQKHSLREKNRKPKIRSFGKNKFTKQLRVFTESFKKIFGVLKKAL